jgi:predicted translin family RNA/ssDNA-binding protein
MTELEKDEKIRENIYREAYDMNNSSAWTAWALLQINETLYRALVDVEDSNLAEIANEVEKIASAMERHRQGEE